MIKLLAILVVSVLICILIILLSCVYVGAKSEKIYRESEIDRPNYIKLEE